MTNPDKFRGKYRISTARRASWDYASNAAYFVTICTQNRAHDFGEITNGEITLTPLGQCAQACWEAIPDHFPFVELGAFVVMPNHVHGIIINKDTGAQPVETQNLASLRQQQPNPKNRFGPQSQNLASIVRGYKIGVTKFARNNNLPCKWQARYHDHVIRNAKEHERIHLYIQTNPQNWVEDRHYLKD